MCSKIEFRSFSKNKGLSLLCFLLFISQLAFGQSGIWTWISGDSALYAPGVYGTQGFPSKFNHPPYEYSMAEWKDKDGNFWVYGGSIYNDLWKYDPLTNEWTWIKGTASANQPPAYGIRGIADPSNSPGERLSCASWVDTSGALWLFGGDNSSGFKNDLWKYDIGTNNWTWVKGDSTINPIGVHGLQGFPDSLNTPGGREETCSAWTDSLNNLWLFGGRGYDDNGFHGCLNDLMKYNISTNEWTWMKGSDSVYAPPNYGTKGVADPNNDPGARRTYTKWKDVQGNFWIMGGFEKPDSLAGIYALNDVWKYDLGLNEWIWMSGTNIRDNSGHYGVICLFDSSYLPPARFDDRASVTDNCGRFWLFGGNDNDSNFNDLWVFDPSLLQWKLLCGSSIADQKGSYGTLGVPLAGNMPYYGEEAVAWWGNDNRFYLFADNDNSALWVYNPDPTCVSMACIPPPVAGFQSSKISICANDCIGFTDQSMNATSWQWLFAGATDSTSNMQNPQSVCYITPGIYNVTLIASNAAGSDTLNLSHYITVIAAPPAPNVIDYPGIGTDTLVFTKDTSYISYQWYKDTTSINGATDTILVVYQNGNYNVEVTGANGCKIGAGINIVIGLQNYMSDNTVLLYPNPVGDKFTVYGLRFTVSHIEILNVLGQVCQQSEITNSQSEIDVSSLPAGIYFVQVQNEQSSWVGKFVKE